MSVEARLLVALAAFGCGIAALVIVAVLDELGTRLGSSKPIHNLSARTRSIRRSGMNQMIATVTKSATETHGTTNEHANAAT